MGHNIERCSQFALSSGFTFLIDDQRRVDGEMRSWPEEFDFEDIVKINVGGLMYETRRSTLKSVIGRL